MMQKIFSRTETLIGKAAMSKLAASSVAVFGIGGVGSFAAEALARAGVGGITLIDKDTIDATNVNRQLHATTATVGMKKTAVMKERLLLINPDAKIETIDGFYTGENAADFFVAHYDYVIDAIDTISGKISLVVECEKRGIPLVSAMGAGNKLDPTRFEVADIFATSVDPIAKVMRKKLKELGVKKLKVVFSKEIPRKTEGGEFDANKNRPAPASISFVPSVAGLILAGETIKDLSGINTKK